MVFPILDSRITYNLTELLRELLSPLIKVLKNLGGSEVNKYLETLYRIRNAISHLPSANISQQDFDRWFNELGTLEEVIEEKFEKPSCVRHLFCSLKDKIFATHSENESIENRIVLAEYALETLTSKVGKTVQPPDEACTFMRSSDLRKTLYADNAPPGQNIWKQTHATASTSNERNKLKNVQYTDGCTNAERRHISTKNKTEDSHYRMSCQCVGKGGQLQCRKRSYTRTYLPVNVSTADPTIRLNKSLQNEEVRQYIHLRSSNINQKCHDLQTTTEHEKAITQVNSQSIKRNDDQVTQDELNKKASTQINKNELSIERKNTQTTQDALGPVKIADIVVNRETQEAETKYDQAMKINANHLEGNLTSTVEKDDLHMDECCTADKQTDFLFDQINGNLMSTCCAEDAKKSILSKIYQSEEKRRRQTNKKRIKARGKDANVTRDEQLEESRFRSPNQKDSSQLNKLPFEKGTKEEILLTDYRNSVRDENQNYPDDLQLDCYKALGIDQRVYDNITVKDNQEDFDLGKEL